MMYALKHFPGIGRGTVDSHEDISSITATKAIQTDFLRGELGYRGLIITDDVEMGALAKHYSFRELGVKAVEAGSDIVLVCHEYPHETDVYLGLLDAVEDGTIPMERVDESVRRIVKAKLLHAQS